MIYELRTYQLRPGTTAKYVKLFEDKGLPIVSRYCTLIGYWVGESGALNRVFHLWSFEDLEARRRARELWYADRDWTEGFVPLALPMLLSQESTFLSPASFSPLR